MNLKEAVAYMKDTINGASPQWHIIEPLKILIAAIESKKSAAASTNSASLACQSCKREHCSRSNPTCMACIRFDGERNDWHEQT